MKASKNKRPVVDCVVAGVHVRTTRDDDGRLYAMRVDLQELVHRLGGLPAQFPVSTLQSVFTPMSPDGQTLRSGKDLRVDFRSDTSSQVNTTGVFLPDWAWAKFLMLHHVPADGAERAANELRSEADGKLKPPADPADGPVDAYARQRIKDLEARLDRTLAAMELLSQHLGQVMEVAQSAGARQRPPKTPARIMADAYYRIAKIEEEGGLQ